MEFAKVIKHNMDAFERAAAQTVYQSIQNAANGTERAEQAREHRLGMSNIGHCQQAAVYMIRQTEPTDERDKSAAFFGTVAGEAIETQMQKDHPGWFFQGEAVFSIPSGGELGCHVDITVPASAAVSVEEFMAVSAAREEALLEIERGETGVIVPDPVYVQGIWDLKSKDKLDVVKKYGPSRQQQFQVAGYAAAMCDKLVLMDPATGERTLDEEIGVPLVDENGEPTGETVLDRTKPIWISDVYFDRSGTQRDPYTFGWFFDPRVLNEIDDWITDTKYAVVTGTDALKEKPREWCWSYCEYATICRGNDTDVEGLIESDEVLAAVYLYSRGQALATAGDKLKKRVVGEIPNNLSGSTGTHNVRWIEVGPTILADGSQRAGYRKLDIRPIPGPKKKPSPRKKKETTTP